MRCPCRSVSASRSFARKTPRCCRAAAAMPTTCRSPAGTLHAHVVRSPHPHADIVRIDAAQALAHGRRVGGHHRRGREEAQRSVPGGAEGAGPSMVARGRARALRRRAGRAGGGREPLSRRGRRRAGAGRIRADRRGDRSGRGLRAVGAAAARRGQDQRNLGPQIPLRRPQGRVRDEPTRSSS